MITLISKLPLKTLEANVADFEKLRPQLKPNMPVSCFLEVLQDTEESTRLANILYTFAGLAFAANTQDQRIQALLGRIQQFMAEMENRTLFSTCGGKTWMMPMPGG